MRPVKQLLSLALSALLLCPASLSAAEPSEHYAPVFKDRSSSYILVFAFPSAAYLDWSNPSALARTSIQSAVSQRLLGQPSTIGHAQFAWSCRRPDGTLVNSGASGQSGEHNGQSLKALLAGWGMSILELVYTDGTLEGPQEVNARIHKGARSGQFSWAGFQVPLEQCLSLAGYVQEYARAEAYQYYGFPVDPLKLEGGGCTSYAHAALKKSGAPLPFLPMWLRDYHIPVQQMGRQAEPPPHSTIVPTAQIPEREAQVALGDFVLGDQRWAADPAREESVHFKYYDPELFYESFLHLENSYRARQRLPLRAAVRTAAYDPFQQRLKDSTDSWMQGLLKANVPMQLDQIAGYSGLVIDLRQPAADQQP